MKRVCYSITGVLTVLALTLSGCGSEKKADPKPKPSKSKTDTMSASPTPKTAAPPRLKQPGAVNYRVLNYPKYADNPAVAGYIRAASVLATSSNLHRHLATYDAVIGKPVARLVQPQLDDARTKNYKLPKLAKVRVERAQKVGNVRMVVTCEWEPSTSYTHANGRPVEMEVRDWKRIKHKMTKTPQDWRMDSFEISGTCPGGAPR